MQRESPPNVLNNMGSRPHVSVTMRGAAGLVGRLVLWAPTVATSETPLEAWGRELGFTGSPFTHAAAFDLLKVIEIPAAFPAIAPVLANDKGNAAAATSPEMNWHLDFALRARCTSKVFLRGRAPIVISSMLTTPLTILIPRTTQEKEVQIS